jgi:FRG domain
VSGATSDRDVNSVPDLLEAIRASGLPRLHHSHIRVWFRGQSNAQWDLSPVVYRPSFGAKDEDARLSKERHLTQDFRAMSAGLLSASKNEAELYFVQQHYRMPTRLLDWTTNPLAALHFAVESNSKDDAAIFALDAYTLGPDQKGTWKNGRKFQGIASSRSPLFEESLYPIFRWRDKRYFPSFIVPVRPD